MKRIFLIILFSLITILSCHKDNDDSISQTNITFNFNHNWDGIDVTNANFNAIIFTNAFGNQMSITKLKYLISNIRLEKTNGEIVAIDGYSLVDLTNNTSLSFAPNTLIPTGNYSHVTFTFGFKNDANYNGNYPDLNAASWNVPTMMGGGYHYMQLEGKFIDNTSSEQGYAYHMIRAVNTSTNPLEFQDTFFDVDLGPISIHNDATLNIEINISEWFKNPNTWDLNVLNNSLMGDFNAQIKMFENGQHVFSLKSVSP